MIDNLVNKNIKNFINYTPASASDEIILNANENSEDIFKINLIKQLHNKIDELDFNRYPDSDSNNLRALFADYINADKDEIIAGVGCDEIINYIINAFLEKDEYTMSITPTFSMYEVFTIVAGGKYMSIPCSDDFIPDIDKIISAVNEYRAKILFLCSPNNPTGYTYSRQQLEKIIDNTSCIVVLDEVYSDFSDRQHIDLYKSCDRVIVLRTMSKAFSLAGVRVGFAVAKKETMKYLYKVKVPYNLNILSQAAAQIMLENVSVVKKYCDKTIKNRSVLTAELKKFKNLKVYDSKSNFLLVKCDDYEAVVKKAKERKVSFKYFKDCLLKDHIRITVGTEKENETVIKLFSEVYKSESL